MEIILWITLSFMLLLNLVRVMIYRKKFKLVRELEHNLKLTQTDLVDTQEYVIKLRNEVVEYKNVLHTKILVGEVFYVDNNSNWTLGFRSTKQKIISVDEFTQTFVSICVHGGQTWSNTFDQSKKYIWNNTNSLKHTFLK